MKKICAFILVAFIFSTTAFAYDHLITNETSSVKEQGTLQAEASILYTTASKKFDNDGKSVDLKDDATNLFVPLKIRWGCRLVPNLEFLVILPFEKWDLGDDGESELGDIWFAGKYAIMPEGFLTLRGALDIPTGDDKKGLGGAGGFGIDIAAMTQKQLSSIKVDGQVGVRYNVEDSDTKWQPGLGVYLDGEGSYELTEAWAAQLGLELMFIGDGKADGNDRKDTGVNWIELNVGAKYKLGENMGLKGDVLYNVAGKNSNQYFGVLVRFCYGF